MAAWLFAARCSWRRVLPRARHFLLHARYSYRWSSWLLRTVLSPFRSFSAEFVSPIPELNSSHLYQLRITTRTMLYSSAKAGNFEMRVNATSRTRQTDMVTPVHKNDKAIVERRPWTKATLTISLPRTTKEFIEAKLREDRFTTPQ